jgi:hypothetical protein
MLDSRSSDGVPGSGAGIGRDHELTEAGGDDLVFDRLREEIQRIDSDRSRPASATESPIGRQVS